jgi:hypothetical protein
MPNETTTFARAPQPPHHSALKLLATCSIAAKPIFVQKTPTVAVLKALFISAGWT